GAPCPARRGLPGAVFDVVATPPRPPDPPPPGPFAGGRFSPVCLRGASPAALRGDESRHALGPLGVDVDAGDCGAGSGESRADALAEPAAASRHERDPPIQPERVGAHVIPASALVSASGTALPSRNDR